MDANWGPATTTLRGSLRTEFRYGPPNYGMSPFDDSVETPIILLLTEPLIVRANPTDGQEGDFYAHGAEVAEVHVAVHDFIRVDWEALAGAALVEIKGHLFPAHTGHHHRPVLINCAAADIRILDPFPYAAIPNARIVGTGSGILLNSAGHILTAHHVPKGEAFSVRRRLDRCEAQLIAQHPELDVAILQADIACNHLVSVRSILGPALGERVYAAGYPVRNYLGHGVSLTEGMVSRNHINKEGCFHFSAPIQPGNSGGPLFDSHGNLLAIIVAQAFPEGRRRASDIRQIQLLNEAIPVNVLWEFFKQHKVQVEFSPFIHRVPAECPPTTQVADVAERTTLEIECWSAAPRLEGGEPLTIFDLDAW